MKNRLLALLLALGMTLSLAACGGGNSASTTPTPGSDAVDTQKPDVQTPDPTPDATPEPTPEETPEPDDGDGGADFDPSLYNAPGDFYYDYVNGEASILCYYGTDATVRIPPYIDDLPVFHVSFDQYSGDLSVVEHLVIPEGVREIGALFCPNLVDVTLPDSLTEIHDRAFLNCTRLGQVNIPAGVAVLGEEAFSRCGSLYQLTLPEGLTTIGMGAFASCKSLEELVIPDTVNSIGENAFYDCFNLRAAYKGVTYDYEHIDDLYSAING